MAKKCIICESEAKYKIKDGNEFYCQECAEESFADLSLLQEVEIEAQIIKKLVDEKIDENLSPNPDR